MELTASWAKKEARQGRWGSGLAGGTYSHSDYIRWARELVWLLHKQHQSWSLCLLSVQKDRLSGVILCNLFAVRQQRWYYPKCGKVTTSQKELLLGSAHWTGAEWTWLQPWECSARQFEGFCLCRWTAGREPRDVIPGSISEEVDVSMGLWRLGTERRHCVNPL